MFGIGKRKKSPFDEAFAPYSNIMPGDQPQQDIAPLESTRRPGFWQGGSKFGTRDALAGILAAVGDAFAQQSGGRPMAVQNLTGGRLDALELARQAQQKQAAFAENRSALIAAGYPEAQANAMAMGVLKPSDVKPDRMMSKSGDILAFGPNGQPQTVHREASPELLGVPGMGVYAMDRHTGQPFGGPVASGPEPGHVEGGYRFKGGDPADQGNWELVGGPTQPASGGFRPYRR